MVKELFVNLILEIDSFHLFKLWGVFRWIDDTVTAASVKKRKRN